jgi:hypothetical protein
MNLFLSSSGSTSREIAAALHDWIPRVIQRITPFMASTDIDKGQLWFDAITEKLRASDYGIICLTKYNSTSPWLHFEGGALSKALGKSGVSPLLFDVEMSSIAGPFAEFQSTTYHVTDDQEAGKQQIWSLVHSLNNHLAAEERLAEDVLKDEFKRWWPELRRTLNRIRPKQDEITQTAYKWLNAFDDLVRKVTAETVQSVWWIAPDPYDYVLRSSIKDKISARIQQGTTYTFFVGAERGKPAIENLISLEGKSPAEIHIVRIPDSEFDSAAVTDYVILNPEASKPHAKRPEAKRQVFLDLPLEQRGFWIEVFAKGADGFYERFNTLKKKYGEAPAAT